MTITQTSLSLQLSRRIEIARHKWSYAAEAVPSSAGTRSPLVGDAVAGADIAAFAVLRDFNPKAFAQSSLAFAASLPERWRDRWFGAYTRTIFLAGNPANLLSRFPFHHVTEDRSCAWLGPAPANVAMTLRRLLVPFRSESSVPSGEFSIGLPDGGTCSATETPRHMQIHVGTAGMTAVDYLVHLNHTLAESMLLGLIARGSAIKIRHVPRLHGCPEEFLWLRVLNDRTDGSRLRAYAGVSACE